VCVFLPVPVRVWMYSFVCIIMISVSFLDGYCSTVQGLLDWLEVDLVRVWTRMYSFVWIIMISVPFALPTSKKCVTVVLRDE